MKRRQRKLLRARMPYGLVLNIAQTIGGSGGFTAALKFNNYRNSQYTSVLTRRF